MPKSPFQKAKKAAEKAARKAGTNGTGHKAPSIQYTQGSPRGRDSRR